MSWFKHRPRPGDIRPTVPHQTGPITRTLWNQTKDNAKSSSGADGGNTKIPQQSLEEKSK